MQNTDSKDAEERILNAAESLFSEVGFEAASMRNITEKAGVNLASVNYYFGSKNKLIMAVLRRIIQPINDERRRMLSESRSNNTLTSQSIVEAFLNPMRTRTGAESGVNIVFFQIVGRCITAPKELQDALYKEFFHELSEEFIDCLKIALPEIPESKLRLRFHFMVCLKLGVLVRMPHLLANPSLQAETADANAIIDDLCDFAVAALLQSEVTV